MVATPRAYPGQPLAIPWPEPEAGKSPSHVGAFSHVTGPVKTVENMEGKSMKSERPKRPIRAKLTNEVIAEIRKLLREGWYQHDIAAKLGVNQGRISEVNTGKR